MAFTRRAFLRGLVVGAAALSLPASLVKAAPALVTPARYWAIERLRAAWLAHVEATGEPPEVFVVGRDLAELYESEITATERFTSDIAPWTCLYFKATPVVPKGRGYGIAVRSRSALAA